MADILLKRDSKLAATSVPNTFIDEYMTHADGEFVKIYLYLLRCMSDPGTIFSISDTADKFDYTEKDVTRALKYWEKMRLLNLEFNKQKELVGICLTGQSEASAHPAASISQKTLDLSIQPSAAPQASYEEAHVSKGQLQQLSDDETVQELLFVAERYLGRQLNHDESRMILYWLDNLDFSQDMIDYLIEYCVAKDRKSIRYMNTIALDWAKHGIRTLAEAKQASFAHSETVYTVIKAFGITNRTLSDFELAYVREWSDAMGFSDELIAAACQRTIRSAHQVNFKYANSILTDWHSQNVHTLNDIKLLDAQFQESKAHRYTAKASRSRTAQGTAVNGFHNFTQRTYDYDKLEQELLTR